MLLARAATCRSFFWVKMHVTCCCALKLKKIIGAFTMFLKISGDGVIAQLLPLVTAGLLPLVTAGPDNVKADTAVL